MGDDAVAPVNSPNETKSSRLARLKRISLLLSKFVSVQVIVQGVGMLSGIIIVRCLPLRDFAYYNIANSMQSTLILLADVGASSAMSAIGGRVWQERRQLGEVVNTGLSTRIPLAIVSAIITVPILIRLLILRHASLGYTLLLTLAVVIGAFFRLTNDVFSVVPKLHARIARLQRLDLGAGIIRLAVLAASSFTYANAIIGVGAASLAFGLQTRTIRRWASDDADLTAPPNPGVRKEILTIVRQQAPNTIYYCVQGQLTIFLISLFGTTKTLADVGALTRLAIIFNLFTSVMTSVVLPRFARCQDKARVKQMWFEVVGGMLLISVVFCAVAALFPKPFLWVLGKQYSGLRREFLWVVTSTFVFQMVGVVYQMMASRAWTRYSWISIPTTIVVQLLLIRVMDFGTVKGAVLFSAIPAAICLIPYLYSSYAGYQSMGKEVQTADASGA